MSERVSAKLCLVSAIPYVSLLWLTFYLSCVPFRCLFSEWAECRNKPFGVKVSCFTLFESLGGGSRSGEALGPLGTTVPQDDSSKGGAAHGPRHPFSLILLVGWYS